MRQLVKLAEPTVLVDNAVAWLAAYLADPDNDTKKLRYRHPDIKSRLKEETSNKCAYCEGKVGHNCPGDVEHKYPSSLDRNRHFEWRNLTLACPECNRRKNTFYAEGGAQFLDPYVDDVEAVLQHLGPVVVARPGEVNAEFTVRILAFNERNDLILHKIGKLKDVSQLCQRYAKAAGTDKELVRILLKDAMSKEQEYSAMARAVVHMQLPGFQAA